MDQRQYVMRAFGIDIKQIPGIAIGLTEEESILLIKIKECQRMSQFVSARIDNDFDVDEEFSRQCCGY